MYIGSDNPNAVLNSSFSIVKLPPLSVYLYFFTHSIQRRTKYNIDDPYSFAKAIFETLETMKENLHILYKQNLLDLFLTNFEIIYKKYSYQYMAPEIQKIRKHRLYYDLLEWWIY